MGAEWGGGSPFCLQENALKNIEIKKSKKNLLLMFAKDKFGVNKFVFVNAKISVLCVFLVDSKKCIQNLKNTILIIEI